MKKSFKLGRVGAKKTFAKMGAAAAIGALALGAAACSDGMTRDSINDISSVENAAGKPVVAFVLDTTAAYQLQPTLDKIAKGNFTHLVYAFVNLDDHKCDLHDTKDSLGNTVPRLSSFRAIKAAADRKGIKTLLAVGGGHGDGDFDYHKKFTEIASSPALLSEFGQSCRRLVDREAVHGIDMDWEWPENDAEKGMYTSLLQSLRTAMPDSTYLLTADLRATPDFLKVDFPATQYLVNWFHVMAYDFSGTWSESGYNAPTMTLTRNLDRFKAMGADLSRLVLGMPVYSRVFKFRSDLPLASAIGVKKGDVVESISYQDVLTRYSNIGCYHDTAEDSYFLHASQDPSDPSVKSVVVSLESPDSIAARRTRYINAGVAGLMGWELGWDNGNVDIFGAMSGQSRPSPFHCTDVGAPQQPPGTNPLGMVDPAQNWTPSSECNGVTGVICSALTPSKVIFDCNSRIAYKCQDSAVCDPNAKQCVPATAPPTGSALGLIDTNRNWTPQSECNGVSGVICSALTPSKAVFDCANRIAYSCQDNAVCDGGKCVAETPASRLGAIDANQNWTPQSECAGVSKVICSAVSPSKVVFDCPNNVAYACQPGALCDSNSGRCVAQ